METFFPPPKVSSFSISGICCLKRGESLTCLEQRQAKKNTMMFMSWQTKQAKGLLGCHASPGRANPKKSATCPCTINEQMMEHRKLPPRQASQPTHWRSRKIPTTMNALTRGVYFSAKLRHEVRTGQGVLIKKKKVRQFSSPVCVYKKKKKRDNFSCTVLT